MASLEGVDFGGGPGPPLIDLDVATSACYDGKECRVSVAGEWEHSTTFPAIPTEPPWHQLEGESGEPINVADLTMISDTDALGSNASTIINTVLTAKTTMIPTSDVIPAPSTTVINPNPNPSLASVGTMEASNKNGSGLGAGAIVGIAIGALIIGAALAFVVAFFLFKRRNQQRNVNVGATGYTTYDDSAPELDMMQKSVGSLGGRHSPYIQVSQTPMPTQRNPPIPPIPAPVPAQNMGSMDVAAFLPPPAQDGEVYDRVSALYEMIHEHIETYYRDVHAGITPSMETEIVSFGAEGMSMTELVQECSSPTTALKHALVSYVMGITAVKKRGDVMGTLFPEEISSTQVERHVNSGSDANITAAASLFRRVSVYLYTSISGTCDSRLSWRTQSNTRQAAEHFSFTFFPWAQPQSSDQEKDEDLGRIITEALGIRVWLFGQADTYEFRWEGAGRRGVVVSPGLVRRTCRNGDEKETWVVKGVVVGM